MTHNDEEQGLRQQLLVVDDDHDRLASRNTDLTKLSKDIVLINEMMTDLSMLVNEQSSLLENIEYNIEETRRTTVEATGELRQAAKSQAKTRKLIMWSVLGVVTAGAVATVVGVVLSPLRTATKVASTVVAS